MFYRSVIIPPSAARTLKRSTENIYQRESYGHSEDRQEEGVLTGVDGDVSTLASNHVRAAACSDYSLRQKVNTANQPRAVSEGCIVKIQLLSVALSV